MRILITLAVLICSSSLYSQCDSARIQRAVDLESDRLNKEILRSLKNYDCVDKDDFSVYHIPVMFAERPLSRKHFLSGDFLDSLQLSYKPNKRMRFSFWRIFNRKHLYTHGLIFSKDSILVGRSDGLDSYPNCTAEPWEHRLEEHVSTLVGNLKGPSLYMQGLVKNRYAFLYSSNNRWRISSVHLDYDYEERNPEVYKKAIEEQQVWDLDLIEYIESNWLDLMNMHYGIITEE